MSLFGTLRKKGKKVHITLSKGPQFSSTPNLNNVAWTSHEPNCATIMLKGVDSSRNPQHPVMDEKGQPHLSLEMSSKQDDNLERTPSPHSLTLPADSAVSGSSMKNFMSLVSMASSLKRLKKGDKKKTFASASNLHRIESERREAVIQEDSSNTAPDVDAHLNVVNMNVLKAIKSAPALDLPKSATHKSENCDERPDSNTEPGVISSSSSTSSCNQSDTSSLSSYNTSSLPRPAKGFSSSALSLGRNRKNRTLGSRNGSTNEEIAFETSVNTKYVQDINKTQLMLQGAKKFNMDPKRGIDFLVLNGIIERTPEDVARFLKDGEGLSKTAIGNYLGEYIDFNLAVLQAFVDLHDFTDVLLVQALRQFLWSFRLPGESQKIDRMMESFAKRYCLLNPNLFKDSDTCYLLSFAIIMLNTSLHNPNVKSKTTLEQFIRMTDSEEMDRAFIASLYNSILEEPFKIPQEDGNDFVMTFFNPDIEGWLWKQGGHYKSWKRRWFILSNNCLYYFHFTTDRVPRGIIPLENILATPCPSTDALGSKHPYWFMLKKRQTSNSEDSHVKATDYIKSCKTLSDGQTVPGKHLTYILATSSDAERTRWVTAISQNSSSHDFYTMLAEKKNRIQALHQKRDGSNAKRGTMTVGRTKKSRSTSSKNVRKSQISLPLTTASSANNLAIPPTGDPLNDSSTAEYNYYDYLLHPGKNPHNYFLTLPSTKSKTLTLSHSSEQAEENDIRPEESRDENVRIGQLSECDSDYEDIETLTYYGRPEIEISGADEAKARVTAVSDEDDEHSTSASEFLINKYSLPIQETTASLLRKYESIIKPKPSRAESTEFSQTIEACLAGLPNQEASCLEKSPSTNQAENAEESDHIYGIVPQRFDRPGSPTPAAYSIDRGVATKRSAYRKETSLDRQVDEILDKQQRCISDKKTSKMKSRLDELQKEDCAERTIERVTSFSKSIITTTVVQSMRQPSRQESELGHRYRHDRLRPQPSTRDGGDTGLADFCEAPSAEPVLINYSDENEEFGKSIIHRNHDHETSAGDNSLVVERFNSIVIGNVRHTEV